MVYLIAPPVNGQRFDSFISNSGSSGDGTRSVLLAIFHFLPFGILFARLKMIRSRVVRRARILKDVVAGPLRGLPARRPGDGKS